MAIDAKTLLKQAALGGVKASDIGNYSNNANELSNQGISDNAAAKYAATGSYAPYSLTSGSSNSGSSTGSYSSSSSNSDNSYYDQLISQYKNTLSNLGNSLSELNKSAANTRNTNLNELQSSYDKNKRSYDNNTTQNLQNNQLTKNKIADNASQGLRGLMRTLGANGAGGSSAASYLAPEAVTNVANAELADANSTYAQNQQNLDTNWNDYLGDYDNDKKKIEDSYQSSLRSNEQNVLNQKNSLLNELISAYANAGRTGEMANATNEINSNTNRINELNKFAQPTYNGSTSTYNPTELAKYNTGNTDLRTAVSEAVNGTNTPTLAMLLGVNRNKKES